MPKNKIVSRVRFFIPLDLHKLPEHMTEGWVNIQSAKLETTEKKRNKVIPDEARFIAKMAGPSSAAYTNFVSPDFVSKKGKGREAIIAQQAKKMGLSYQKYKKSLELLNQDGGKRFKERIAIKKEVYEREMARTGLPFTGETTTGPGICKTVPAWLTGQQKIVGYLDAASDLDGGPVNIARMDGGVDLRSALKAAISGQLSKSGVIIINSEFNPDIFSRQNTVINAIIRGMQDTDRFTPFETGGQSHCDFLLDDSKMFLEVQISEK
jgi:hypothetical protein